MMATCGLLCHKCDIFLAIDDKNLVKKIAEWFNENGYSDIKPKDIHCKGCKGNKDKHWSPDCWIIKCCVDEKGLEFCYECKDFPCEKLQKWSKKNDGYRQAFERLKKLSNE